MATYTSNLNLYMPDSTDDFGEFREEHNDNMVKIDNAIGGGGGGGGHTIIDQSGNSMPNRTGLQFIGASVTDDSVNNKTVVTVTGGGGGVHYSTTEQVIGTWIDGKPIYQRTWDFSASPVMLSYANWVNSGISAGENIQSIISAELKYGVVANMAVEVAVGADGYPVAFQKVENAGNTRGVEYCTLRYTKTTD